MARGHSIKVRHDDIHQHQVIFGPGIHLVDSLQTVQLREISQLAEKPCVIHLPRYQWHNETRIGICYRCVGMSGRLRPAIFEGGGSIPGRLAYSFSWNLEIETRSAQQVCSALDMVCYEYVHYTPDRYRLFVRPDKQGCLYLLHISSTMMNLPKLEHLYWLVESDPLKTQVEGS